VTLSRVIHLYGSGAQRFADLVSSREPERRLVVCDTAPALEAQIQELEVLFAPMPPRSGWRRAKRLDLIQLCGVGVDHFLPSPDLPESVEIAGMRGAMADDVAEHAMLMWLALTRALPSFLDDQRAHAFRQRRVARLRDQRLAIVGLGSIGRSLASRAQAFGAEVRGLRRSGAAVPGVQSVVGPDGLHALLAWCDAVVICTPRTDETRGLFDAAALAQLRPGATLINVARGGIVREPALLERLHEGTLQAALDVFETEPLAPSSPFFDAPNTIVTPHVAGFGSGYEERAIELLLENVRRLERGEPRTGVIDRSLGY